MVSKEDVKILCLDDAPIILSALKRELMLEGYPQVTINSDGEEALSLVAQEKYDLYIVDQTMPDMLGTEFVERLSKIQTHPLVFILTGQDLGDKALELCRGSLEKTGADIHYFTKPWDTSLFIEIQRALEMRHRRHEMEKELNKNQSLAKMGLSARKIAHEIRNPLGIISGAAQLLENNINRFESSSQTCTEIIVNEVNRLSNLLDDLSAYNNAHLINVDRGNINHLLDGVVDLLRIEGKSKNIRMEILLDPSVPDTLFDARKIYQAFLNVGKNAVEAMGEGGHLSLTTSFDASKATITIRFADSGSGIAPENLDKIFDLFFTSKGDKGNGIGLAVSKQFVTAHGGEIWAESELGRGATFFIRLYTNAGQR